MNDEESNEKDQRLENNQISLEISEEVKEEKNLDLN